MMLFLALISFFVAPEIQSDKILLQEVRSLYAKSTDDEADCEKLMELLPAYDKTNNETLKAYRASTTMVMARHAWTPMSKLSLFKEGKEYLELTVLADPDNLEIRFLRFSIQSEAPSFLGYYDSIDEDKNILISSLNGVKDKKLQKRIADYLKTSDELSDQEKQMIHI